MRQRSVRVNNHNALIGVFAGWNRSSISYMKPITQCSQAGRRLRCAILCRLPSARRLADQRPSTGPQGPRGQATQRRYLRRRWTARRAGPWSERGRSVAVVVRLGLRKWWSERGKFAVFRARIGAKNSAQMNAVCIPKRYEHCKSLNMGYTLREYGKAGTERCKLPRLRNGRR